MRSCAAASQGCKGVSHRQRQPFAMQAHYVRLALRERSEMGSRLMLRSLGLLLRLRSLGESIGDLWHAKKAYSVLFQLKYARSM